MQLIAAIQSRLKSWWPLLFILALNFFPPSSLRCDPYYFVLILLLLIFLYSLCVLMGWTRYSFNTHLSVVDPTDVRKLHLGMSLFLYVVCSAWMLFMWHLFKAMPNEKRLTLHLAFYFAAIVIVTGILSLIVDYQRGPSIQKVETQIPPP